MQLYTVEQVAEKLQLTKRAVTALVKRGQLPAIDVCVSPSGRKPRRRISEVDLQAFLESRRYAPPPPHTPCARRRRRILSSPASTEVEE
jgi:excisionase family DNA binding protein